MLVILRILLIWEKQVIGVNGIGIGIGYIGDMRYMGDMVNHVDMYDIVGMGDIGDRCDMDDMGNMGDARDICDKGCMDN